MPALYNIYNMKHHHIKAAPITALRKTCRALRGSQPLIYFPNGRRRSFSFRSGSSRQAAKEIYDHQLKPSWSNNTRKKVSNVGVSTGLAIIRCQLACVIYATGVVEVRGEIQVATLFDCLNVDSSN